MNRYDKENALHTIDGYFIPRIDETKEDTFKRAKDEAIKNYERLIGNINLIKTA